MTAVQGVSRNSSLLNNTKEYIYLRIIRKFATKYKLTHTIMKKHIWIGGILVSLLMACSSGAQQEKVEGQIDVLPAFENLTELWLATDPYKHRLMRICGVAEHFITGDATPFEKFEKYCQVFPYLAGNPVYDWSRMELSSIFHIDELPTKETAT